MEKLMSPEFRVSFPAVFEPVIYGESKPKYSVVMLFDKSVDLLELKNIAKKAVEAKWPDPEKRPKNLRNPFRDGDAEKPDVPGYENVTFVNASSLQKPGLVDANVQDIIDESEFYAGCYARATLTAYAYDTKGNKGVSFGLQNIQKIRDGDPFSGKTNPQDDFNEVATTDVFDDEIAAHEAEKYDIFA